MPFTSDNIVKTFVPTIPLKPISPVISTDYQGEYVNWTIGDEISREFIPKSINYYRSNSTAIVFGNGISRSNEYIQRIVLSNRKKIINYYNVLYGCNLAYTDFEPDFLIVTNKLIASKIPKELHNIIFTRPEILRINREMNLIPMNHNMDAGSTAAMIACYHGASKVFLYGFDGCPDGVTNHIYADQPFQPATNEKINDIKWQEDLERVIAAYPKTIFYRVNASPPNARSLLKYQNYKVIDLRTFVSLADI